MNVCKFVWVGEHPKRAPQRARRCLLASGRAVAQSIARFLRARVCACVCMRVCVRVCMRACEPACARARVNLLAGGEAVAQPIARVLRAGVRNRKVSVRNAPWEAGPLGGGGTAAARAGPPVTSARPPTRSNEDARRHGATLRRDARGEVKRRDARRRGRSPQDSQKRRESLHATPNSSGFARDAYRFDSQKIHRSAVNQALAGHAQRERVCSPASKKMPSEPRPSNPWGCPQRRESPNNRQWPEVSDFVAILARPWGCFLTRAKNAGPKTRAGSGFFDRESFRVWGWLGVHRCRA